MRKVTFTNSLGVATVFGTGTYFIELLEGLSTPNTIYQDQKSPYQDGSTYIDTLMDVREITLQGAIKKPKNLIAINADKDTLIRNLSPKLGQGTLLYEADGVSRKISATAHVVFNNKHAMEPWQKFQVQFRCCDPYWKSATSTTINLPTPVTNGVSVINNATTTSPSIIQLANGNLFIAYKRGSDDYIVTRTSTNAGISWSSESVAVSAISENPCVIQKANGDLFMVYVNTSTGYIEHRIYTSSWSTETVVQSSACVTPCIILLANGNIYCIYRQTSDGKLYDKKFTTSWSAQVEVNGLSSYEPNAIQLPNGNILAAYRRGADSYIALKTFTSSWSEETVIQSSSCEFPKLTQLINGNIQCTFILGSVMRSKVYTDQWETGFSTLVPITTLNYDIKQLSNEVWAMPYISILNKLEYATRSVTPVNAQITGHTTSPVSMRLNGPSQNPRITKQSTLEQIRMNYTLVAGDYFIVNTTQGQKTIEFWKGGIRTNGMAYLDQSSTFFDLEIGDNTVYFEDDVASSTATATMTFEQRYIGC